MSFRPEKRKALREFSKLSPDEIRAFWSASSKLSAIRMDSEVRELLLAHSLSGLHRVYDQNRYLDEKADALSLWHTRLRRITAPLDNIVPFRAA